MKALEKAAKDREETDADATRAPAQARPVLTTEGPADAELTLQPLTSSATARESAMPREPASGPRGTSRVPADTPSVAHQDPLQAATVLRAGMRQPGVGASAYVREHPIMVFGVLASLFLLGYGTYVYLQMTNPGIFIQQTRPAQIAPPPTAPQQATQGGAPSAAQQPLSTALVLPSQGATAERSVAAAPNVTTAAPVITGTLNLPAPAPPAAAAPPLPSIATASPNPAVPAAVAPAPAARENIRVSRSGSPPTLNPLLSEAYQALDSGNLDASARLYGQVLQREPNNIDALLGAAAVAAQKDDGDAAARRYLQVLQVDPRNTLAQAGLIGMVGRADPLGAETRVKQLIARDPSAYLYFTLGNVYVDQNRWSDAQQAYFQAHHLQPDNPDYAYNLAVGLEHVGQPKLALNFYRRASQLAAAKGRANFSTGAALERIGQLERAVE